MYEITITEIKEVCHGDPPVLRSDRIVKFSQTVDNLGIAQYEAIFRAANGITRKRGPKRKAA